MPNGYDYTYGGTAYVGGKPEAPLFNILDEVYYAEFDLLTTDQLINPPRRYPAKVIKNDLKSFTYPLVISYEIEGQEFIESLTADGRHSPNGQIRLFKKPKKVELQVSVYRNRKGEYYGSAYSEIPEYKNQDYLFSKLIEFEVP